MNDDMNMSKKSIFNFSNILIMIALIVVLVLVIWNQSFTYEILLEPTAEIIGTSIPTLSATQESPIPAEFYSDVTDTSGIINGAIIILLIIISSSIWKILQKEK